MPSLSDLEMVGQTCSSYQASQWAEERSCASCTHWLGEEEMCELDIFWDQLTSLDQT
ncbi:MAG: hypothetical protein GX101_03390 [Firmicutes bacterium]|nr:hypothetical protein [Bacillota bacterium]NLO65716.1 hypothetical protein [Bacillota bacterium]